MNFEKTDNDLGLWQLIAERDDKRAFELLYRKYMHILMSAIYKFSDDRDEAEDILQEVFLDLWEKRGRIQIKSDIFSYLYSMTRFKVFDRLKKKSLSERQLAAWHQLSEGEEAPAAVFVAEELAIREARVNETVAQLPSQMKRVYYLSASEGKNIREISEELLVSPYTVKNHLQKIRKRLRNAVLRMFSVI